MSTASEKASLNSTQETLRSSYNCDGTRLFLIFDAKARLYRLATRWYWLSSFDSIWDACDAFEALELMEGNEQQLARTLKTEIKRVPRHVFGSARNRMGRINYLINSVERRVQGLRPVRCGSKGSVERWIPA
ncbi:TPA: hypothetical protein L5U90_003302 [Pseudomonas aeruginosa]|nr:hypothetical protein [Pseudomonas aeruginosa]